VEPFTEPTVRKAKRNLSPERVEPMQTGSTLVTFELLSFPASTLTQKVCFIFSKPIHLSINQEDSGVELTEPDSSIYKCNGKFKQYLMKIILTGATGMVGEGVLRECLIHPSVEAVLIINRKPSGFTDPKLTEIIHKDFFDLSAVESRFIGYDACLFCLGVSSVGIKEHEYTRLTYDLTMNFARTVSRLNPQMVFCYISGAGTDSTEKGRIMWARVKGKTENDLMKLPFRDVYAFRPGVLIPSEGAVNVLPAYKFVKWLVPAIKPLFPAFVGSLNELGKAMINVSLSEYPQRVLNVRDIRKLSE
jgi:hypothetical protein